MHSPSNLLVGRAGCLSSPWGHSHWQGLWRSAAQHNPVGERKLSKANIIGLRALLVSSGLFLAIISALLAFGVIKR